MKLKIFLTLLVIGTSWNLSAQRLQYPIDTMNCQSVLYKMFDAIESLKTAKFKLISTERIDNEMQVSSALGTIQYNPRKLFFRSFDEQDELSYEILYIEGENNDNATISPNGFPYFNINLDPLGSTIRNNRHLCILDAGGVYLVDMIRIGMEKYSQIGNLNDRLEISSLSDTETLVTIKNMDYDFTKYTVLKDETIRDICYKLGVPEYKILELNESVSNMSDIHEGQEIIVPTVYATKFELILRKNDFIPTIVKIYDDKGLFATYEYVYFEKNPSITAQTFSKDNPAYTF
jgi:outer membrane lipoprotein-sorting protein